MKPLTDSISSQLNSLHNEKEDKLNLLEQFIYELNEFDKALMLLARNVEDILRQDDVFARMGGEEFMIILSSSKLSDGLNLAERVRKLVESIEIPTRSGFIHITVTLAVASYSKSDLSIEDFYIRLDDGLYKGKRAGRNRVVPVIDELNEFNDKSL